MEENKHLLRFIDYLYAVIFGLVVRALYEEIVSPGCLFYFNECGAFDISRTITSFILFFGAFWFVVVDWLDSRGLNEKYAHRTFRRFFIDVGIAFLSYGVFLFALKRQVYVLLFMAGIHVLGAWWAHRLKKEYPAIPEAVYLNIYIICCLFGVLGDLVVYGLYLVKFQFSELGLYSALAIFVLGFAWSGIFDMSEAIWVPDGVKRNWCPSTPIFKAERIRHLFKRLGQFIQDKATRSQEEKK
jgi:hypothetical protein